MHTLRVVTVILFSAFALWAQAPKENRENPSETASVATRFSLFENKQDRLPFPPPGSQFNLKSDPPQYELSELGKFQAAGVSEPLFSFDPQATRSKRKPAGISKGYFTRRKIHKYASLATLPLLAAESIVGQKLLDENNNGSLRSAHSGLAAGIGVLFGVETVTGVWNMMEMRKYPGNKKRLFHGILMLAADAGFFATAVTAPGRDEGERSRNVSAHKALAYASIGTAAFSYIYMLIAK